eukprot:5385227-Ditylum_brightwellii.AAC.1
MPPQSDDVLSTDGTITSPTTAVSAAAPLFQTPQDVWDTLDALPLTPSILPTKSKTIRYQFKSNSDFDRFLHIPGKTSLGDGTHNASVVVQRPEETTNTTVPATGKNDDLNICYQHHDDFVKTSNGMSSGMQLALTGRLEVSGDHKHFRLLSAVMDAARQKQRVSSGSNSPVESSSSSPLSVSKSNKKVRRSSMTKLLRIGSM